jgi:hypothetical protein
VANDQNGHIGRAIVCAVVKYLFAANGAIIIDLEIPLEQGTGPAIGAFATPTAQQCGRKHALIFVDLGDFGALICHVFYPDASLICGRCIVIERWHAPLAAGCRKLKR